MTLEMQDPEVNKLAQELARITGETILQAVANALRKRLEREKAQRHQPEALAETLLRIGRACAALPLLDSRPANEILGYNEAGVPT